MPIFRQVNGPTGGSSSSSDNFSYETISSSQIVTVPAGQQMLVNDHINNDGLLINNGIVEVFNVDQGFGFPEHILSTETYGIGLRRQVILQGLLDNEGILENFGTLIII